MNWHAPTQDEWDGRGGYEFLVDIVPDGVPHQAAVDGDALLRVSKHGWSWIIRDFRRVDKKRPVPDIYDGQTDTKEAAIGEAQAALATLRDGRTP